MAIFLIGLLFCCLNCLAQPPDPTIDQDLLESIFENQEEPFDLETYLETLNNYRDNPINLNTATPNELANLMLLSQVQILEIINYKNRYGDFLSVNELIGISGLELDDIFKILPYIYVGEPVEKASLSVKNALKYGRHHMFIRYERSLQEKAGYIEDPVSKLTPYTGTPDKLYGRYRFTYANRISAGLTTEKDAGEALFSNNTSIDFISGHLMIKGNKTIEQVVVGDYQLNFGQGLVMWSGFGFGKSPQVLNTRKTSHPLSRYSSVNENRFLRGAATSLRMKSIALTLFASSKKIDANITELDTLDEETLAFTSLQETGLHRTTAEIADRKAITQSVGGIHIKYGSRKLDIGMTGIYTHLSASLETDDKPYNRYRFSGNNLANVSLNYTYQLNHMLLFGETALSHNGSLATLNGMTFNIESIGINVVYRDYSPGYQQLFARGFGEGSNTSNEKGIYLGLATSLSRNLQLQAYVDFYRKPWLSYQADAPSAGSDYLLQLDYKPAWHTTVYGRYKFETKQQNKPDNAGPIDELIQQTKSSYRLHVARRLSSDLSVESRLEISKFAIENEDPSFGWLIYQELAYKVNNWPMTIKTRYTAFNIGQWENRIYTYESDVLYAFSVPAFSGKGSRAYVLLSYRLGDHLKLWGRIAHSFYPLQEEIGTGNELIEGNKRTDLKLQMRWSF